MAYKLISRLKHQYLIKQVKREKVPDFAERSIVRKRIVFEGKVQKVGFRFQVCLLAEKLGLTGTVENLPSGAVEMDVQGNEEAIQYIVRYMQTRKRLTISRIEEQYLEVAKNRSEFLIA